MNRLEVIPYSQRWPDEFREIAAELRNTLAELALRIDHVGSTSVPELVAKDVIDVQVAVAALDLQRLAPVFASIGYEHLDWVDRDHTPPWATTADQWRKLLFQRRPPQRRANVHVRVAGAANARYALLFRDYLRAHARAASAYGDFKKKLVALDPPLQIGDYTVLKDPTCDIILAAAEEWAAQVGWQPRPSDA